MTDDLVAFLRDRLAEDERLALAVEDAVGSYRRGGEYPDGSGTAFADAFPSYPWGHDFEGHELRFMAGPGHPSRVLAEVAARRAIVQHCGSTLRHAGDPPGIDPEDTPAVEQVLRLLAQPYADHPQFREEWKT